MTNEQHAHLRKFGLFLADEFSGAKAGEWRCPMIGAEAAADVVEAIAALRAPRTRPERLYDRCPACGNDTLIINDNHLLCTWVGGRSEKGCPNPLAACEALEDARVEYSLPLPPVSPAPEQE